VKIIGFLDRGNGRELFAQPKHRLADVIPIVGVALIQWPAPERIRTNENCRNWE
jgi:hypothetical protein